MVLTYKLIKSKKLPTTQLNISKMISKTSSTELELYLTKQIIQNRN